MTSHTLTFVKARAMNANLAVPILAEAVDAGFRIVGLRQMSWEPGMAALFYAEHAGRPYFNRLVDSVSAPFFTAAVLERNDGWAVEAWRDMMGPSDPSKARPDTLRWKYAANLGEAIPHNALHGSDGPGAVIREAAILFGPWKAALWALSNKAAVEWLNTNRGDTIHGFVRLAAGCMGNPLPSPDGIRGIAPPRTDPTIGAEALASMLANYAAFGTIAYSRYPVAGRFHSDPEIQSIVIAAREMLSAGLRP